MNEYGQAKKGGELGINGAWYEGGQFMPTSESTVKGAFTPTVKRGTKKEIEPYVWDEAPADDVLSIYDRIHHSCADNRSACNYVKGRGFAGFRFTEIVIDFGADGKPRSQSWMDFIKMLFDRFNRGERWFPLSEDPFHYKNQKKEA